MTWLFPTIAWSLAALALALLAWALFWDRARGRKRCPKCWYDMSGSSDQWDRVVCPECGSDFRSERQLYKTRRKYLTAALSFLVLAPCVHIAKEWTEIADRGWVAAIPSTILIHIAPVESKHWQPPISGAAKSDPLLLEAALRLNRGLLARWQSQRLVSRIFKTEGNPGAVDTRGVWPAGFEVICVPHDAWFAYGAYSRFRLAGAKEWTTCKWDFPRPNSVSLGPAPFGVEHVDIEYELWIDADIKETPSGFYETLEGTGTLAWSGAAGRLRVVPTPDAALTPVEDPSLAGHLERCEAALLLHAATDVRLGLQTRGQYDRSISALRAEIMRNDVVVGDASPLRTILDTRRGPWRQFGIHWRSGEPTTADMASGTWSVRFTADPALLAADPSNTTYWSGSVTRALGKPRGVQEP